MILNLNNKHKTIIIIFVVLLIAFTSYNNYLRERKTVYILSEETQDDETNDAVTINPITSTNNTVIVHIEGEVMEPGIYTLSRDARVIDVVKAAGGLKDTADTRKINLAKRVADEEFVYIPSEDEVESQSPQLAGNSFPVSENRGLININYADKGELESLPGIGPTLADRIIEYRNQLGGFKSIEDIQNVSGIGEKKYSDIKDKITI